MATFVLGKSAVKAIHKAIATLFAKAKARFLGQLPKHSVGIHVDARMDVIPHLSVPGIFVNAAVQEYTKPDEKLLESLNRVTTGYLDAYETQAKTKVVAAVDAVMQDAAKSDKPINIEKVLTQELNKTWDKVKTDVSNLAAVQTNIAKNAGGIEGIVRTNANLGVEDPVVAYISIRDKNRCWECERLHCMPDGVTPRCWYLSEIGAGYHHRGDANPKMAGLHPHCFTANNKLHTDKGVFGFKELFVQGLPCNVIVDNCVQNINSNIVYNPNNTGTTIYCASNVYYTGIRPCYRLELANGTIMEVSDNHEHWVDCNGVGKVVCTSHLCLGDSLPLLGGGVSAIKSIQFIGDQPTYCLTEPMTNTLSVNGVVTKNCRCSLISVVAGYGFDPSGALQFIGHGHNEIAKQRGGK